MNVDTMPAGRELDAPANITTQYTLAIISSGTGLCAAVHEIGAKDTVNPNGTPRHFAQIHAECTLPKNHAGDHEADPNTFYNRETGLTYEALQPGQRRYAVIRWEASQRDEPSNA